MKNNNWSALAVGISLAVGPAFAQAPAEQTSGAPATPPATVSPAPPAAIPGAATVAVNVPPSVTEVIRLAESGTGEDVILAFIQNSPSKFNLSADAILYLKDLGLTSTVITAMLTHDNNVARNQPAPSTPVYEPPPAQPPPQEPPPQEAPPQEAASASAPVYDSSPPAEVNYFYNDLAPYGTWVNLSGVGWCWQPRAVVISHGWRPYCDGGHWVYSDCGWYWQSDYSWGWAPFHYGRWQMHSRCGWVWTPDRVWGPAWVTWRRGGDYCGWAPLPPHAYYDAHSGYHYNGAHVGVAFGFGLGAAQFTFVATRDFNHHDVSHRQLHSAEVKNIYNNTTIINNYTVKNNNVVNQGIPVEHVAAATHTQIHKAVVRDVPAGSVAATRRTAGEGATPVVFRHDLKAPVKTANMVAQKVDDKHPIVQHAPIATARVTTNPRPLNNASPSTGVPRHSPTASPNVAPRQTQKTPFTPTYQTPPKNTQPQAKANNPTAPVSPSKVGPQQPPVQASQIEKPNAATTAKVPQATAAPRNGQTEYRTQNPQVYYPKTYHQSADIRPVPRPEPAPRSAPRETPAAPARPSNDSNSNSKKP